MNEGGKDDDERDQNSFTDGNGLKELAETIREREASSVSDKEPPDVDIEPVSEKAQDKDDGPVSSLQDLSDMIRNTGVSATQTLDIVPGSDVLILESSTSSNSSNCIERIAPDAADKRNVLLLAVSKAAKKRVDRWKEEMDRSSANVCAITFGNRERSRTGPTVVDVNGEGTALTIKHLPNPSDLVRLGITVSRQLMEWQSNPYPIHVCFDSLTQVLQYVEPQRLFRFLHILQSKLETTNATTHYHMRPDAHNERTLDALRPLFDTIVRITEDGVLTGVSIGDS